MHSMHRCVVGEGAAQLLPFVFGGVECGLAPFVVSLSVASSSTAPSYFLLPGDATVPIIFSVKRLRDGASFATRACDAIQRGKVIFRYLPATRQLFAACSLAAAALNDRAHLFPYV